jgi:hypothetical protein
MDKIHFHGGEAFISFSYILLPVISGMIHARVKKGSISHYLFLYYLFIGVGIQGVLTGIVQMFFPQSVVQFTEWTYNLFLLELGMANTAYGILGLLTFWVNKGWQLATAVGYGLFLFLTGVGHVVDIFQQGLTLGNAGTFLLSDLLVGLALLILAIVEQKTAQKALPIKKVI